MVEQASNRNKVLIEQLRQMFKTANNTIAASQTGLNTHRKSMDTGALRQKKHSFVNTARQSSIHNKSGIIAQKEVKPSMVRASVASSNSKAKAVSTTKQCKKGKISQTGKGLEAQNSSFILNQSINHAGLKYPTNLHKSKLFQTDTKEELEPTNNRIGKFHIQSKFTDNLNLS